MLLLFGVFGILSLAALGVLLASILSGTTLLFTRFKTVGLFVLLIPSLSAVLAVGLSWGAAFYCNSMSERPGISLQSWERWQVLALWAWPLGFILGGFTGAGFGTIVGVGIVKRRNRKRSSSL